MPVSKEQSGEKLRVGVSACLIGHKVRYDGEHKRDAFVMDQLGPFVEWVVVCPELEVGMGVPRESVRLVRQGPGGDIAMLGNRSQADWTARMEAYAARKVKGLDGLTGYVLKSRSPSCGMERVKVYDRDRPGAMPAKDGVGLFAAALRARFPNLPVEEEGRLSDPRLRENFIERLFAYQRLQRLFAGRWTVGALVAFHTAHKMSLLGHSETGYRELGRLVAQAAQLPRAELRARYENLFMATLSKVASRGRQTNVLMHMAGHLKQMEAADKVELLGLIDDYRRGMVPLVVPVTLLRHHVNRLGVSYLQGQVFLEPHPKELMLRNHV